VVKRVMIDGMMVCFRFCSVWYVRCLFHFSLRSTAVPACRYFTTGLLLWTGRTLPRRSGSSYAQIVSYLACVAGLSARVWSVCYSTLVDSSTRRPLSSSAVTR